MEPEKKPRKNWKTNDNNNNSKMKDTIRTDRENEIENVAMTMKRPTKLNKGGKCFVFDFCEIRFASFSIKVFRFHIFACPFPSS